MATTLKTITGVARIVYGRDFYTKPNFKRMVPETPVVRVAPSPVIPKGTINTL